MCDRYEKLLRERGNSSDKLALEKLYSFRCEISIPQCVVRDELRVAHGSKKCIDEKSDLATCQRECAASEPDRHACYVAATQLRTKQPKEALALLEQSCGKLEGRDNRYHAKYQEACFDLALAYEKGWGCPRRALSPPPISSAICATSESTHRRVT